MPPPPDLLDGSGKPVAAEAPPPLWSVEIGLFASAERAQALIGDLKELYPTVTMTQWADQDGLLWYSASLPSLPPVQAQEQARRFLAQGFRRAVAIPPSTGPNTAKTPAQGSPPS
jgi:hypothetical protein